MKVIKVSGLTEASFLCDGYTNWKDTTRNFANHEKTVCHQQATVALQPKSDVSEMLSSKVTLLISKTIEITFLEFSHQLSIWLAKVFHYSWFVFTVQSPFP